MTERLLVKIHHNIVDLTGVVTWHPGGSHVLTSNRGADVTDLFEAFHANLSYHNFIVGTYESVPPPYVIEFRDLHHSFKARGWYTPPKYIFCIQMLLYLCLFASSLYLSLCLECTCFGAIAMGFFWQQTAGLGHDLGHSSSLGGRRANMVVGSLMSTITGLSSAWWRHSHFQHHVHTNVIEEDPDILHLPIFSVSDKLSLPFYHNFLRRSVRIDSFAELLIRVQHVTMYPILMFARFNLYVQSIKYIHDRHDLYSRIEKLGILSFLSWHALLLARIGATRFWKFALLSHFVSGILHVQIVISHWASDVKTASDTPMDHFLHTLQTTIDVKTPECMDWFHLGLQFQVAHHMYPRLPRCHLREATRAIQQICRKHNLVYNAMTFGDLNRYLLSSMKRAGSASVAKKYTGGAPRKVKKK